MATSLVPDHIQGRNPHYVNHEDELAEAAAAVAAAEGNLVIVFSGPPGSGKTATARELAFRIKSWFPDGVLFADLRGALDREGAEAEVLRTFLVELGVDAASVPDRVAALRARYQTFTAGRRLLVVVDGAVRSSQVRTLMPGDGRSLVLATAGQGVSDLAVDTPVKFFELSPLSDVAALELLQRLLGAERVAAEPGAAAELIVLCGHLPIALCVVASMLRRPRNRTIASTVERLRDEHRRLSVLSPPSDLSVDTAFTAAYRQLGDSAQRCYRALGLAPRTGRVSAEALAEALAEPFYEVAESLAELWESGFIEEIGPDRYAVNDLVALHASFADGRADAEKAAESARLVAFHHQRSYDADAMLMPARPWRRMLFPELRSRGAFGDAEAALAWLEEERQTLARLLSYAYEMGDLETVCSWCVLLWPFYESGKHLGDLFATHDAGIDAAEALRRPDLESLIRLQKAFGHSWAGELGTAASLFTAAAECARVAGILELEATALEGLGLTRLEQRDADAVAILRRNLELAGKIGDGRRIALAQLHLAKAEPPDIALRLLAESGAYFENNADVVNRAKCATWQGKHLLAAGRNQQAKRVLVEAVKFMAARGRRFDQAEALVALGDVRRETGDVADARDSWREALSCYDDLGFAVCAREVRNRLASLPG
ncbi:NB-ARC domain-containing protein [Amycolatopsis sp. lyj-23]|uniref:NB-ARC domain-containing protein n=1 Tax=Amycolatopsis sp. lyj-23 TaxID=2789283 RepID=UPI00397C865A